MRKWTRISGQCVVIRDFFAELSYFRLENKIADKHSIDRIEFPDLRMTSRMYQCRLLEMSYALKKEQSWYWSDYCNVNSNNIWINFRLFPCNNSRVISLCVKFIITTHAANNPDRKKKPSDLTYRIWIKGVARGGGSWGARDPPLCKPFCKQTA